MMKMRKMTVAAKLDQLDEVLAFLNGVLEEMNCPLKKQMQLNVALEELFVNIANYAYTQGGGTATIVVETEEHPRAVEITLIDTGVPYDPLQKPDPDVTLPAEERQIGGLGIYMVKKSMDGMEYEYRNGQNILTIRKLL